MKKIIFLLAFALVSNVMMAVSVVSDLRVNRMSEPQGLDDETPSFSWIVESDARNVTQTAYEIRVYEGRTLVWSSGRVNSSESTGVPYLGRKLTPGTKYSWQVRIWDNYGKATKWSSLASWLTGMFSLSQWKAQWIEPAEQTKASPLLRKSFSLTKPVKSAVAYITAHGMYEAMINGAKVGNAHYAPGWTSYNKRLQYQAYDVTDMLASGTNVFGIIVGYGWYHSVMGWPADSENNVYDIDNMGVLAQIVVTYKDGASETIVTDGSWKSSTGAILSSTIYDGETVDARKEQKGWASAGFDDSSWTPVVTADYSLNDLVPSVSEPVITHKILSPVKVFTTPKGEKVVDFGQNLTGREIFEYKGRPGQEIVISHAEVLDKDGNFYTGNLRSAKAQSRYICSGEEDRFEPAFTFYGFRYMKVEGIEGELDPNDFKAAVIFSGIKENGRFTSSNPLVNQLQSNIHWSLMDNFLDVPTDCPQRDERLGWTGDAQNFFRTATFNRDVQNFFRKWLKDLVADQFENGAVTDIVPYLPGLVGAGHVGWADAATIIPWQHYMAYGDRTIIEDQYESMKAWVDFIIGQSENWLWNTGWHYGDWLFYSVENDNAGVSAVTYTPLVQQCHFANSADIMAASAELLGKEEDARKYADVAAKVRKAFAENYITPSGMLVSNTQTAYVLALEFDMIPENLRAASAAYLARNVESYEHITTGFLGTPHICNVLTENGYNDLAYKLLLREDFPGWLYEVKMGATTIWERWNSLMPDGSFNEYGMNSFNHYSYGAIGDWLYRNAVGIKETSAGFKTISIMPHPGADFTHMSAEEMTPYGKVAAGWEKTDGKFILNVTIPVNTAAEIYVPADDQSKVTVDGLSLTACKDVAVEGMRDGYLKVKVGSGTYRFESVNNL